MIEVLFVESEAASMKIAKNTIVIRRTDGPISIFLAGKQKGNRIEGSSDEVICLGLMLDIGNIKEARFIGDLLGKNRIGISDLWYAKRIDFHIAQGNIAVTGDSERKYERMICLA